MYINITDVKTIMKIIDEIIIEENLNEINKNRIEFAYEILSSNLRCYYYKLQRGLENDKVK